jgi:superfamily II DNA or RNA helicase
MPRHGRTDPRVQQVGDRLAHLVLRFGSVNAVAAALSTALGDGQVRIYPNRIHGLLTDDPARGVNTATLEALELATAAVHEPPEWTIVPDRVQAAFAAAIPSRDAATAAQLVADELGVPVGVITSVTSLPARDIPLRPVETRPAMPDWSWQDVAVQDSLLALQKKPGVKVGLVLPTGAGKTRVALRIALRWLRDHHGTALWVTHRHHLERQARRSLQELIRDADVPAEEASAMFARVRFTGMHGLQAALEDLGAGLALVIVDEAHHAAAPSYQPIIALDSTPGLFLTATPNRTDELSIGIDEIAYTITYRELFRRRCVMEPVFDPAEEMPDLDWASADGLRDLADFLLERTETDFAKPLVAVSRRERAEQLHEALLDQLARRGSHPLSDDDIGYVHGAANSRGLPDSSDFLDEFAALPAGILIATSQLVGEGFNDPSLDAAVITYPSTSIGHLMQVAGRALRWAPGKKTPHVVQVRQSPLEYYFDQRWLYEDISDTLRPDLVDHAYSSPADLRHQVQALIDQHKIRAPVAARIQAELETLGPASTVQIMFSGHAYFGAAEDFATDAAWGAIMVTPGERERFTGLFNEVSARSEDIKEQHAYLARWLPPGLSPGSLWRSYGELIPAMEYARRETQGINYHGQHSRGYRPGHATTWLRYVTFRFRPTVPPALEAFLADAYNRETLLAAYVADPGRWSCAVRIELPVTSAEGMLLDHDQAQWFLTAHRDLMKRLADADRRDALAELARWRTTVAATPVALRLLDNMQQFLRPESIDSHLLRLDTPQHQQTEQPPPTS